MKKKDQIKDLYALGLKYLEKDNLNKSKEIFLKVINLDKTNSNAYSNIGLIEKKLSNLSKAKENYKKAIYINKRNYIAYNNLANIYKLTKNYKKAKDCYFKSIKINSKYLEAYINLALLFEELGEFSNSIKFYKKVLNIDENNFEIYLKLSQLDKSILNKKLEKKIDYSLKKKENRENNIDSIYYIKAKFHLLKKEYNKELEFLLKAHENYFEKNRNKFSPIMKYWFEFLPKFCNLNFKEIIDEKLSKYKSLKPIFIIGLPRSGSTVLEKILISGKNKIISGEETGIINNIVKKKLISTGSISFKDESLSTEILENYTDRNIINKKINRFTDKSLENFFFINLIINIFPHAKIINCKRDIFSCVISIIKNNLKDLHWAHKIEHIYKYIEIYLDVMNYYKNKFPEYIYDVSFDDIIQNPNTELKKIFNFCEIDWDQKCLDFYKQKNLISKTASNVEIRKPIYSNIKNYDVYRKFLKPNKLTLKKT